MLSVAKIAPGQESYYLDTVAAGLEDYYSGRGEAPGRWTGAATKHLDLEGRVDADALGAVLGGRDPETGTRLGQLRKDRVPGFDLTFSAPKSVSVLWGLGDPDTAAEVRAAHDAAVDAALGWLEREGCRSRRGVDGHETVAADGFVAAAFVHRSSPRGRPAAPHSRPGRQRDPLRGRRWRALDGKALLWQARTAGLPLQGAPASRAHRATRRRLGPGPQGRRRDRRDPARAVRAVLDPAPRDRRRARRPRAALPQGGRDRRVATPADAKDHDVDAGDAARVVDRPGPRSRLTTRAVLDEALGRTEPHDAHRPGSSSSGIEAAARSRRSHRARQRLRPPRRAAAWCEHLPHGRARSRRSKHSPTATTNGRARRRAHRRRPVPEVLDRGPARARATTRRRRRRRRPTTDRGAVAEAALRAALDARPELSPEQVAAVAQLTTSGNGVDVFVAAAGTGKTFCLDAARDAWTRAGHHVIGAALAATAAAQLQAQTAIPSDTIALRALQLADGIPLARRPHRGLVIDEAAMVGTRQLAALLDAAARRAARRSCSSVTRTSSTRSTPAGSSAASPDRVPPVTLNENRRQHEAWERDALASFARRRHRRRRSTRYDAHDRIVTAPTAIDLRNRMAADWYAATLAGDHVVMLAERRYDVDDLNRRARHHCTADGRLSGPVARRSTAARSRPATASSASATTDASASTTAPSPPSPPSTPTGARSTIRTDAGTAPRAPGPLPRRRPPHPRLRAHDPQEPRPHRRPLPRPRHPTPSTTTPATPPSPAAAPTTASTSTPRSPTPKPTPRTVEPRRPADVLAGALTRDRTDRLAIDHQTARPTQHASARSSAASTPNARALLACADAMPPDRRADIAALTEQRDELADRAAEQRARVDSVHVGLWHRRERTRPTLLRRVVPRQHHETTRRRRSRARRTPSGEQRQHTHYRTRTPHRARPARRPRSPHRSSDVATTRQRVHRRPPDYLKTLGPYPTRPRLQKLWQRTATDIERYRAEHDVTDHDAPPRPRSSLRPRRLRRPSLASTTTSAGHDDRLVPTADRGIERGLSLGR